MKHTDGFDARRLRPRGSRSWGARIVIAFGVLLALAGTLLVLFALASLFGAPDAIGIMAEREASMVLLGVGSVLFLFGIVLWRRARRRFSGSGNLSMSRSLMRRR